MGDQFASVIALLKSFRDDFQMQNYVRKEGFFKGENKINLYLQSWEKPQPKGIIFITHGQGEHSDCYNRLVQFFASENWTFYAWDLRGHGKSEGKRGYAASLNTYIEDYRFALEEIKNVLPKGMPLVLLSHSMGGLIQLRASLEDTRLQNYSQVFSAPLLGLSLDVPQLKKTAAQILSKWLPQVTLNNEISEEMLTRDPDVIREFQSDVLRHTQISSGVFLGMLDSITFVHEGAKDFQGPMFFQIPEKDPVVNSLATQSFFDQLSSTQKKLITYGDGAKHEMFNDTHRNEVYADLKKYLDSIALKRESA